MSAKRSVVIFRHGKPLTVSTDSGLPIFPGQTSASANSGGRTSSMKFGHPGREICEGKEVFQRTKLVESGAHRSERKDISGTLRDGCESLLVENQDPMLREDDGLCWLQVTRSKSLGGGFLAQSYQNKEPVRVFRSSELDSMYAPALYEDEADSILYRYDGLYAVKAMWDSEGKETSSPPPNTGLQHTFFLTRYPKKPVDGTFEAGMHYNKISIHELWNEIQKRSGVRKPRLFQVPQPFMEHAPIGDQSNVSRRRKENIKLPSEENLKNRKARRKRKNASSPDMDDINRYSVPMPVQSTIDTKLSNSCSYSDSESEQERDPEEIDSEGESDTGSALRPKRASAAAARSFLQQAMLNKYSIGQTERPTRKRRPSIKMDYSSLDGGMSKRAKAMDSNNSVNSDMSDEESNSVSDPGSGDEQNPTPDETVSLVEERDGSTAEGSQTKVSKQSAVPVPKPKRANKRKLPKQAETGLDSKKDAVANETESTSLKKTDFDPTSIQVGDRVNVEYRDVLYKATIKRLREKDGSYDYQIHYDGNKKTNLRWIRSTMVNNVIWKATTKDAKPAAKKSRKAVKTEKEVEPKVDSPEKEEVDEHDELPELKFKMGADVYVEYRKVLYAAVVRKTRLNRRGYCEYLVHYDGFKKAADRWVKMEALFDIDDETTHRFNQQRADDVVSGATDQNEKSKKQTHSKHSEKKEPASVEPVADTKRTRGRASAVKNDHFLTDGMLDMGDHDAGVEFLPGSCVFVVRKDALYLAKMMKRKKVGKGMEYLVHFENSTSDHDTWAPLSTIYEINPKTRRIFDRTADKREIMIEEEEEEEEENNQSNGGQKQVSAEIIISPTRSSSRRTSKKPVKYGQEDDEKAVKKPSRINNRKKPASKGKIPPKPADLSVLNGIDSGCDFLPGSTIFVLWKGALYLAKMLKRRGKGNNMEYLVHYDGFNQNQDAWVSVSLVYEINPQTKRVFGKQMK